MSDSIMKNNARIALQLTLWIVCAFHLVIGGGVNLSDGFVETAARMYGAEPRAWNPQFLYILRPLGVFMVALSVLAAGAARSPARHRLTIYVFAGIFFTRGLQRILFDDQLQDLFGIDRGRNFGNMIFFFFSAALLIVLDQLAHRSEPRGDSPPSRVAA